MLETPIFKLSINALATLFLMFVSLSVYAGEGTPYNKIVFFGDSLSDNGNLYSTVFGFMPKSPPYFQGRFSNGSVWSEYAAQYFYDKNNTASANFAVGGETAVFHDPINGFLPFSLTASVDSYLIRTTFRNRSNTLFIIWIGANDYLGGTKDVDGLVNEVTGSIKYNVERLIYHGAKNFLLINLPDLSNTPFGRASGDMQQTFYELSAKHNAQLELTAEQVNESYKEVNIHVFNLNNLFNDVMSRPEYYNQKFNTHISDTTTSCWTGGYTLQNANVNESVIEQQFVDYLKTQPQALSNQQARIDPKGFAHFVVGSPALREAYMLGRSNAVDPPCNNPDEHIFWDHLHPTAVVHKFLAQYIIEFINQNYALKMTPLKN